METGTTDNSDSLRRRLSKNIVVRTILGVILVSAAILILIGFVVGIEGYYFPYPAIDTRFAPDYSEANFKKIKKGMTKEEVRMLIGAPLDTFGGMPMYRSEEELMGKHLGIWHYADDNAFLFWDFAWLQRSVEFDVEGRVERTVTRIHYN